MKLQRKLNEIRRTSYVYGDLPTTIITQTLTQDSRGETAVPFSVKRPPFFGALTQMRLVRSVCPRRGDKPDSLALSSVWLSIVA